MTEAPDTPESQRHPRRYRAPLVLLVRHGETDFNVARRFQGQLPVPLNNRGRLQARRVGQYLANLMGKGGGSRDLLCERLLSSDLPRAWETAAIIGEELGHPTPPEALPALREIDVGHLQGYTFEELQAQSPNVVQEYLARYDRDPDGTPYPGGESRRHVAKRMTAAFDHTTRKFIEDFGSLPRESGSGLWQHLPFWKGLPCEIWVSHGAALGILIQELGITKDKLRINNTDCLAIGNFAAGARLLHHAESSS